MEDEKTTRYGPLVHAVSALLIVLSAAEVFALFYWGQGTWLDKLGVLFAVVGAYGIAVAFFAKSKTLAPFRNTLEDLTSPHPAFFVLGNVTFAIYPPTVALTAMARRTLPGCPPTLRVLGELGWFLAAPIVIVYTFFHLLVIAPLSYFPTLAASALVSRITYAGEDYYVQSGTSTISMKALVSEDTVAAKGFVMGVPSLVLALLSRIISVAT